MYERTQTDTIITNGISKKWLSHLTCSYKVIANFWCVIQDLEVHMSASLLGTI